MTDLATLLSSNFSILWYEGVALVREISERLIAASTMRAVPELQQIRLSAEGRVEITGAMATDEPVRRMGQLLQALLAHSEMPVQLRLFVTQATAPSPPYPSVREYSEALAFFERPDRSVVLHELAARIPAMPQVVSNESMTLDTLAPLYDEAHRQEEVPKVVEAKQSNTRRFAAAAIVILIFAGAAAFFAWTRGLGPRNSTEATALASRASDAVGDAVIAGASAVTERLGLGRIVPASQATSPLAQTAPAPPPPPQPKPAEKQPEAAPLLPLLAFDLDPTPGSDVMSMPPARATPKFTIPEAIPEDDTIYSVDSPGVKPPVAPRKQIARELPPSVDRTNLTQIDLIIGKDGAVESAKLLDPPQNVYDGLFLSVAKAWIFEPALKNGMPVRYRKIIWVTRP